LDIETNADIAPILVHRNLWRSVEGGGKLKCYIIRSSYSQTFTSAKGRQRYIGEHYVVVCIYVRNLIGQHILPKGK